MRAPRRYMSSSAQARTVERGCPESDAGGHTQLEPVLAWGPREGRPRLPPLARPAPHPRNQSLNHRGSGLDFDGDADAAPPTNRVGANWARLRTLIRRRPSKMRSTDRCTSTSTSRVRQLRSTVHRHHTSDAPFAAANLAASRVGEPRAPNGRNVTGAAANAAASAAPAACCLAARNPPTSANSIARTTNNAPTASRTGVTAPRSLTVPRASLPWPSARR